LSSCLLSKNLKHTKLISPVILYGCETWVYVKRVLKRMFEPKKEEVPEGWRRLHNKELYNLYASPSIIRIIRWRMK
jgi:hypothetical protein